MQPTFFSRYRLAGAYDGSPEEIGRSGPAINYKARDIREDQPVAVQVIPISSIDPTARELFEERGRAALKLDHLNIAKVLAVGVEDDSLVLVSEYVEGETADAWLATHGPMPADAVLRIGLQVVRALAAAAYHGITHRAIQPSNILLMPGQTAEGGWPLIKLLNFGLAGQEVHSNETSVRALAPPISPQFASPEQLLNKPLDFRSELYSLGASMCFLLTGAVPLAVGGMKARLRARRLPELRRAPRALHRLLVHMLRENPENRPHDFIAFEAEMRDCLTKIERRQALGRKIGLPLGGVVPRTATAKSTPSVGRQVALGFAAVAALLLTAAIVAAFLLPADAVPFLKHRTGTKLVGVPDNSAPRATVAPNPQVAATTSNQPSPVAVAQSQPVNSPAAAASASPVPAASASPVEVASSQKTTATPEPAVPAQGPNEHADAAPQTSPPPRVSDSDNASSTPDTTAVSSGSQPAQSKSSTTNTLRKSTAAKRPRIAQAQPDDSEDSQIANNDDGHDRQARINQDTQTKGRLVTRGHPVRARVVGITPDGRLVLKLPSGRIVTAFPGQQGQPMPSRRTNIQRLPAPDADEAPQGHTPYQPFNPDYPFGN